MTEQETVQEVREGPVQTPQSGGPRRRRRRQSYTFEQKLAAVRLHLQEGFPQVVVRKEIGMGASSSLCNWVKAYQAKGEAGLRRQTAPRPGRRLPAAVTDKIIELKKQNPWFGVKRITLALRRWFFLEASPETVRKRLHEAALMEERPRPPRNITRPRFFERASANQMWQSDIFTFRLGGKYAYVVAFMDDYSRYIVSLDLYRSPTAEAVIETYRVGVGEYHPPKEMLTDRGRQYTNWRGKSRFAKELAKDGVIHIVSRPHHPMTLGKIERFWASLWPEFLVRAQFDSFESARERLKLWVKYYNHRRPHQGVGGLCPADRFFEIHTEVKKTIQAGIQENLLELALRGQPKAPFYLVGRMDGQSVVLKAEKGKLKLSVDEKELTYDIKEGHDNGGREERPGAQAPAGGPQPLGRAEGPGGAGGVDGAGESRRGDEEPRGPVHDPAAVAGAGDGGHAAGPRTEDQPGGRGSAQPAAQDAAGAAPQRGDADGGQAQEPAAEAPGGCPELSAALNSLSHGC